MLNSSRTPEFGGYDDSGYALTTTTFDAGETLTTAFLRDSGYGYRSVREIQFATSLGKNFFAGPGGFDNEVSLNVDGCYIAGCDVWVNPDNFINALLFKVHTAPPPPTPKQPVPYFETAVMGNQGAASNEIEFASQTATARYLAVRWDGDKVRGKYNVV